MATVPLVLVHGHPFDHTMWRPQIEAFSASRRVVAPDLRGYGTAVPAAPVERFERFAEDIEALLDELDVTACVLAGLSMGGQVAMDCYRLFPERIRGLVLADTFPAADSGRVAVIMPWTCALTSGDAYGATIFSSTSSAYPRMPSRSRRSAMACRTPTPSGVSGAGNVSASTSPRTRWGNWR